jgi:hypothetical protein
LMPTNIQVWISATISAGGIPHSKTPSNSTWKSRAPPQALQEQSSSSQGASQSQQEPER